MHPDEIFGGYPWFYRDELLHADTFPWSRNIEARTMLLNPDFAERLNLHEYTQARYAESLQEVPRLDGENAQEARRREIAYLNMEWFMQTLLARMDAANRHGAEALVPFADVRIIDYLWNVPWAFKSRNGVVKGVLRDAFAGLLPPKLLNRKKSPFPKTYNPAYTQLLKERLTQVINDTSSPILPMLNVARVRQFADAPQELGKPWFGQLMAGPQMMAYLLQVNYWLKTRKMTYSSL
ncbi:MAG: asparagine synthase C-terminal domain-containing protein [Oscillospiraceae bacterium]|nr:asparagine synthase C-terminal domain-containing protein [Oscillospiraceae bacterium]